MHSGVSHFCSGRTNESLVSGNCCADKGLSSRKAEMIAYGGYVQARGTDEISKLELCEKTAIVIIRKTYKRSQVALLLQRV